MGQVPATEFKAKCLELMDRVAARRESFVITKRGRPVARLVPVDRRPKDSIFGWLRGRAEVVGDIMGPAVAPETWEALGERKPLRRPDSAPRRRRERKAGPRGR